MEQETNREIENRHFDEATSIAVVSAQVAGLRELFEQKTASQDGVLLTIKEQTIKTNGHVAQAFREIDKLKSWRAFLTGAWAVITAVVVPVMLYLFYQRLR